MKFLKKVHNYIPLFGILLVFLWCILYLKFLVPIKEIIFFVGLLGLPVIVNAITIYLNYKEYKGKEYTHSNIVSVILQAIGSCILGIYADNMGRVILFIFFIYIIIVNAISNFLIWVISKIKKLSIRKFALLYTFANAVLFVLFMVYFVLICY